MEQIINFLFSPAGTLLRRIQFAVAIIIFVTMVLSPNPPTFGIQASDVTLHFTGNVLLVLSAWAAIAERYTPLTALLISIPFSLTMELSQSIFTAVRTTQAHDFIANITGMIAGFLIASILKRAFLQNIEKQ